MTSDQFETTSAGPKPTWIGCSRKGQDSGAARRDRERGHVARRCGRGACPALDAVAIEALSVDQHGLRRVHPSPLAAGVGCLGGVHRPAGQRKNCWRNLSLQQASVVGVELICKILMRQ